MAYDNNVTAIQEQVLNSIRTSQEATVNAVRAWAETVATVTPNMFQFLPIPNQENVFGFTEKLLEAQRDFVSGLFEASAPVGRAAPEAARQASAAAGRATSESARPSAKV